MDENETVNLLEEPEILRNKYPESKRKNMPASAFCGPGKSFPVMDAEDVIHASQRLHNASGDQSSIKSCVIGKAKANGWPLPETWKEKKSESRAMELDVSTNAQALERARQAANHPPMTGRHSHGHPHEIDSYAHEHSHEHANDNMHDHEHMHANRALTTDVEQHMYVPITRIDPEKWEVEGTATNDAVDSYGTIFDYESSKKAFEKWRGNIREMHQNKAVGRAIEVTPDNDNHAIYIKARVSKGAKDTWEKVLDGTLSGFSIGVPKDKYKLKTVERNGRSIPMYYDHELAEVSLVDNPGNLDCNIAIVRADGVITEVLDDSEEPPALPTNDLNRAGARVSHATQSDLHGLRDSHFQNAKKTMQICACDECNDGVNKLDPDGDGDIDLLPSTDWDHDGGSQNMMSGMNYNVEATITRHMQPLLSRMQAILSQHIQQPQSQQQITQTTDPELTRHIEAMETRFNSELGEVRSLLSEVKGLAEKIANTPLPGGPVATPVPVDKRLATQPAQGGFNPQNDIAALQRAAQLGVFADQESQVNAAAKIIALQRQQGS